MLTSDSTQFLDGTQSVIHAGPGDNFIFATPINPANPALNDDYTIFGGPGDDVIFAGSGNVSDALSHLLQTADHWNLLTV